MLFEAIFKMISVEQSYYVFQIYSIKKLFKYVVPNAHQDLIYP